MNRLRTKRNEKRLVLLRFLFCYEKVWYFDIMFKLGYFKNFFTQWLVLGIVQVAEIPKNCDRIIWGLAKDKNGTKKKEMKKKQYMTCNGLEDMLAMRWSHCSIILGSSSALLTASRFSAKLCCICKIQRILEQQVQHFCINHSSPFPNEK